VSILLALGLAGLLGVAAGLKPEPCGHGTHEQLGLPPCSFSVLFHRPCPSCGMTTAWACLVRAQPGDALRANAGGTLLAILAAAGVPWLLASAAAGRWLGWKPRAATAAWLGSGIAAVTLVQWMWRLWSW
jgi:hypothetical protein